GLAPCAEAVNQAGVDRETLTLHQHGVGRRLYPFAHVFNQSVADHHSAPGDHGPADGYYFCVAYGHRRTRLGRRKRTGKKQRCDRFFHKATSSLMASARTSRLLAVAIHRFLEVSLGIAISPIMTALWPEPSRPL